VVCELEEHIGMTGVSELTRADEVFAAKLTGIETFFADVLPVKQVGCLAPTATLISSFDIGFATKSIYVRFLEWVGPLGAVTNKYGVDAELTVAKHRGALQAGGPYDGVEGHSPV
jgi:hypothetical protein